MKSKRAKPTVEIFRNSILNQIELPERARIVKMLTKVPLSFEQVVYQKDRPIRHVYFVESGVVSIVNKLSDGTIIEVATVGNEGMLGLPVFLRGSKTSLMAFAQIPGEAWRMKAEDLARITQDGSQLRTSLTRYVQALMTQIAQAATCNRIHSIEERAARWILMTHDRVGVDDFPLTHKFLAQMLGVRRAGVSEVMARLQRSGLLRYVRGRVTVLNRKGLEKTACECYRVIREEFRRLVGAP